MSNYIPRNTSPRSIYDFLLQQMAAESYFDTPDRYLNQADGSFDKVEAKQWLILGTNRKDYRDPPLPFNDGYPGLTRMTDSQAQEFVDRFEIIHQWSDFPNGNRPSATGEQAGYLELNGQQILANTGFSATLIKISATEYTLAMRSTEFRDQAKGGDGERDTLQADKAIFATGFALAQLDAMEQYYSWLIATGKLPATAKLNVTGYSLGGHLATVFTEIHNLNGGQTVTFNGAGRGKFVGSLEQMLKDYRSVLLIHPAIKGCIMRRT